MRDSIWREVRDWIYRNGRMLEIALWRYHFEGGRVDDVLSALAPYQNPDGGFGNTLEPDNWNPDSSPYVTNFALNILKDVNFFDMDHPLYRGVVRYLTSERDLTSYGWRFTIPTNDAYPRAPWWNYSELNNFAESAGLTCELCAFVLSRMNRATQLYDKAERLALDLSGKLLSGDITGDMGVHGFLALVDALRALNRTEFPLEEMGAILRKTVNCVIERDPKKWATYCAHPSDLIRSPESPDYAAATDVVRAEIDYLLHTRAANGVWGITWTWFGNGAQYASQFAISENWWKAHCAVMKMQFLSAFGAV